MSAPRRCLLGCPPMQTTLFNIPASPGIRACWFEFLHFDERGLTKRDRVCARHFTESCFINYGQYSAGLAKELILEDTAVPSVYTVGTSSSKIPTRDVACQYSPTQRDVFIQTSRSSVSKTTSTRSKGISCRPAGHSVAVGCSMADFPDLLLTSTPIKGKRKRVQLEELQLEELSTDSIEPTDPMDSTYQPSFTEISQDNASAPPLYESRKYMVFEENLLQLLRNCPTCMRPCQIDTFEIGTLLSVKQTCSNCVITNKWQSQPFIRDMPVGNLQLSAAVCFNGASFLQIHKVLSSLRMASICPRTFNHHQSLFLQPTILWQWRAEQQQIIQLAKQCHKPITLGGDMRADSPGHCAKYGSYTTMVLDCNKVVDIQLVQSNEVGNSQRMEREGFERSLHFLESEGLDIGAIVTDRHPSIGKFMREQRPSIRHLYDTWHVAKGLQKRIDGLGKMKGCGDVALWRKSCVNHLYWCGASSKTPQEAIAKWTSIVNHMHNVHQHDNELYPKCPHPPLEREWLQPHTKASERLCDILQSPRLLKDIEHLSPQYQSSSIEGFHSLIIQFAPKSKHFPYLGMLCRILLAALHYNENSDRGYSTGPNGEAVVKLRWPKFKKGEFSVHRTRPDPTYNYVNDLQKVLFEEVVVDPGRFQELKDKVDIPENLNAQLARPDPNQAIALPWSRFAQEEQQ